MDRIVDVYDMQYDYDDIKIAATIDLSREEKSYIQKLDKYFEEEGAKQC